MIYVNNNKLFSYETSFLLERRHVHRPNKLLPNGFAGVLLYLLLPLPLLFYRIISLFFRILYGFWIQVQNYTLVNWDARNSFSFGVYLCTFSIFCHTMTLKTQINRCVYLIGEYADGSICTNANECKFKRSPNWLHVCICVHSLNPVRLA